MLTGGGKSMYDVFEFPLKKRSNGKLGWDLSEGYITIFFPWDKTVFVWGLQFRNLYAATRLQIQIFLSHNSGGQKPE